MPIKRTAPDADAVSDVSDARVVVSALGEYVEGGFDDLLP
jgi:hypothetical protein